MKMMDLKKKNKKKMVEPAKKYPVQADCYKLHEEIGQGGSAIVYCAECLPLKEIVAVKVIDCQHEDDGVEHETQLLSSINNPNVVNSYCSFANGNDLWIVMPYMDAGSCHHLLKYAFPKGFKGESVIATILYETLKGLAYLHDGGHVHRDIKAGNILIDGKTGSIKLGDLGVSACLYDSVERFGRRHTFTGTPCWMAPEVIMPTEEGYGLKADIWSFGITALELAYGHAPFSKYPLRKVLTMTLDGDPPGFKDYEKEGDVRKFSVSFRKLIAACLVKEPGKRPHAKDLLNHSFFKHKSNPESVVHKILKELPDASLVDRMKRLREKERDLIEQKRKSNAEKEEMSQIEYKRGISNWEFNLDAIKKQSPLLQDDRLETIPTCSVSSTNPQIQAQSCSVTMVPQEEGAAFASSAVTMEHTTAIETGDDKCKIQARKVD